jgi:nitroreductase
MIEQLMAHRTIRKYKEKVIEDGLVRKILEAGCRASTTGNMQLYSIIITQDQKRKAILSTCHFKQPMVINAPLVLTFCADFNRFNKWCKLRNAEPGYDNFLSFVTSAIDALIVAQNVTVAAESEGLGVCYLGTTTYLCSKIIETLGLPKGVVPVTTLTIGWPDEDPERIDRLPLDAIIHRESYQDYTTEQINNAYREKENRSDNRQFVDDNNKESLAQVFTDIRYKKEDNIVFSSMLLRVLTEQGFMNQ